MYKISVEKSISAAHQLPKHPGKCRNLHGHNWRIRVTVGAPCLDEQGMVMDFSVLKKALADTCEQLDHLFLNEVKILAGIVPTAENLARVIFEDVNRRLSLLNVGIEVVEVWETPGNKAEYRP